MSVVVKTIVTIVSLDDTIVIVSDSLLCHDLKIFAVRCCA